jgi:thiol-disulfide isomerase/thioredoxin
MNRIANRGAGYDRVGRHRKTARLLWLALCFLGACKKPVEPTGIWHGFVKNPSGEQVAFTLDVKREGGPITGALVNGDERVVSTGGTLAGDRLTLRFDFYDGELQATIAGDELTGAFTRQWQKQILRRELSARRASAPADRPAVSDPQPPRPLSGELTGEWVMKVGEAPNQRLWRAAFTQSGDRAEGTIIPVTGDWGRLTGTFEHGELKLNRFDGINSRIFRARLNPAGQLEGIVDLGLRDPVRKVIAERLDVTNKDSVAALPDPNTYTRMNTPAEPFRFSFPDLGGQTVSWNDARFQGKAVVVTITGSWCPNCHDEAPVLEDFYQRYKARGLEVVALAFEYTGETARDLEQVKIFAKRHGLSYPMLLAGSTAEGDAQRKMPQLVNFGAFPTTIYIGRDGLVKHIHAGFEGKATGERFTKLKADMEARINELLNP